MSAPRAGYLVAALAAAGLAAVVYAAAQDHDARGIGGVLRFHEDGRGVTVVGNVLLAGFIAAVALLLGTWVSGGIDRRLAIASCAVGKAVLALAVVFMFLFPDLSQFEAKSLTWRAVLYPTLGFAVLATHLARRLRGRASVYPAVFDGGWTLVLATDIVSNDLHWYGTWKNWDDFVHFANSVPFFVTMAALVLVAERRGRLVTGFRSAVVFASLLYVTLHTLWEIEEHLADRWLGTNLQPGGMMEATDNNLAGFAGAIIAIVLLVVWRRAGRLEPALIEPLDAFFRGAPSPSGR